MTDGGEEMDIRQDLYRYTGKRDAITLIETFFNNRAFRRIVYHRYYYVNSPLKYVVRVLNRILSKKQSIDLPPTAKIGPGLLLLHPCSITINSKAVVGKNLTILKGATIGNSKTGKVGAPVIGDNCYIGLNATVVGGITIGDNVMIAPNTFVNFDVPDGAIVLGSPGVIHPREKGSEKYIVNPI